MSISDPAANRPAQERRRAPRLLRWVLPLLVLVACEAGARLVADQVPRWYGAAERVADSGHIDAVFVGSSRVQAAIPTDAFVRAVAARTQRTPVALNLGRGYSTFAEHYLGLRNLVQSHPSSVQGLTVFVEAPGALPFTDRLDEGWADPGQHQLLVDLLRLSDLPSFWRSTQDRSTKLKVTARFFARQIALINRRERLRSALIDAFSINPVAVRTLGEDLQGPGPASSIRTDPEAIHAARELAIQLATRFEQSPTRVQGWQGTIVESLRQVLEPVGGHLVFFVPPESDVFRRGERTPARREDAAVFAAQVQTWGACLVTPQFAYTDEDLPDLWHLRPERSPEYTSTLVDAWLSTCKPPIERTGAIAP